MGILYFALNQSWFIRHRLSSYKTMAAYSTGKTLYTKPLSPKRQQLNRWKSNL